MFYNFVRLYVRLVFVFFCRSIRVNDEKIFQEKGPLLLACNHPNSFLDAVLLGAKFNHPVHYLARGDAFKNPFVKKLLIALKAIPIYRLKEGREYLSLNDTTFEKCSSILQNGGIVLIFSEGLCMNQWELRPLKKGSARIALTAWNKSVPELKVIPVTLNYNSFRSFRKRIIIEFQQPIKKNDVSGNTEAGQINSFNQILFNKLHKGILISTKEDKVVQFLLSNAGELTSSSSISRLKEIQQKIDEESLRKDINILHEPGILVFSKGSIFKKSIFIFLFSIPALCGYMLNYPIFYLLKKLIARKTVNTVFYDSAFFAAILIVYPFYYLLINLFSLLFIGNDIIQLIIMIMPLLSLATFEVKDSLQGLANYFLLQRSSRLKLAEIIRNQGLDIN